MVTKTHFSILIIGIMVAAFLYVIEQNAILGDEALLASQKSSIEELHLQTQEMLYYAALDQLLEDRFEAVKENMSLEYIREFSFIEVPQNELSFMLKRYE